MIAEDSSAWREGSLLTSSLEQECVTDPAPVGRVSRTQLIELETLTGLTFNVVVCEGGANDVKTSSHHAYSTLSEFQRVQSLQHAHVLLQTTASSADSLVEQYKTLKAEEPHTLSCCALIPSGQGVRWRALMRGWQHVATLELPDAQGTLRRWAAWYDARKPKLCLQVAVRHALTMQFAGHAAGLPVHVLGDTGASEIYVTRDMLRRAGLRELPLSQATVVEIGDGSEVECNSTAVVPLRIKGYKGKLRAYVLPRSIEGFDIILGDSWMKENKVVLDFARRAMVLRQGRKMLVLKAQPTDLPAGRAAEAVIRAPEHQLLGALQMKRELRLAGKRGCKTFLVTLRELQQAQETQEAQETPARELPMPPETAPDGLMQPAVVQRLLRDFADVFPAELPAGEPPDRGVGHTIPTIDGHKPPARPLYRMSPREMAEVRRQVQELLEKGLIQPSTSPYASPVLFVAKKDGSLRMCIDYRALNKVTVRNQWPLPRIDDLLDSLHGATVLSSLDLHSGYHQIRIAEEDRPKSAFRTPQGLYEFKVLSFGLANAPSTFQACMQRCFAGLVGRAGSGVLIYLDDILVYSRTAEEHEEILTEVLRRLRHHQLYAKLIKCEFNQPELRFLGHLVGRAGIRPDPAKTQAVRDWPRPRSLPDLRSFLGLANYFRRFIKDYARRVAPLQLLLAGKQPSWNDTAWGAAQQQAFDWVKQALTSAPTLASPSLDKAFTVTTDASIEGIGAVLEQDGRPVAFESRKLIPAETRYTTTEQELLAVVHALKVWRCFLEGGARFTVKTDHNPNTYFHSKPLLSRREARWSEFLQQFDFEWQFTSGKSNAVADPLSRIPAKLGLMRNVRCSKATLAAVRTRAAAQETAASAEYAAEAQVLQECRQKAGTVMPVVHEQAQPGRRKAAPRSGQPAAQRGSDAHAAASARGAGSSGAPHRPSSRSPALLDRIKSGYADDPWFADPAQPAEAGLTLRGGLWWTQHGTVAVPGYDAYKEEILWEEHDSAAAGHMGITKTLHRVRTQWWWPTLAQDVKDYVAACDSCQRNKGMRLNRGLLQSLQLPMRAWDSLSMDWITCLPVTGDGFDCILVIVDRLTKMVHLVPCRSTDTASDVARHFVHNVWRLHGLPREIVSDRDPKFTGAFWTEVCRLVGCKQSMSTAFHPQSDGQTERMNRTLEDVLRHYVGQDAQSDWAECLDAAEYAINTAWQESVHETPFYLNYGQHPNRPVALAAQMAMPEKAPAAKAFVQRIQVAIAAAKASLLRAQDRQKAQADKSRTDAWTPAEGDQVMLHTKNLSMEGVRKLLPRWLGPFTVEKAVNAVAFRLALPPAMSRLHPVFHLSLLKPWVEGVQGRTALRPPPLLSDPKGAIWQVERLLDHRDVRTGSSLTKGRGAAGTPKKRATRLPRVVRQYLVKWQGYDRPEDNTWEPESSLVGGAKELLSAYWAERAAAAPAAAAAPVLVGAEAPAVGRRSRKRARR